MRLALISRLVGSYLLIAAGAWLVALAPAIARSRPVERLGEAMHWPGAYALTTRGCFFIPDHDRWASGFVLVGWATAALGVGIAVSSRVSRR